MSITKTREVFSLPNVHYALKVKVEVYAVTYMRFFCCKGTIFKYLLQIQSFGFSVC